MQSTLLPRTGLTSLKKEMDQLFDRFWAPDSPELPSLVEWAPTLDVIETKDTIVLKAEVPGIDPKDIHASFQDQILTIKGEKREEKREKDDLFYRMERSYGAFARSFRLPVSVEAGKVNASFKNGVLTVILPKAPEAKAANIPIREE